LGEEVALKTNITVKKRITVNGREYERPEDMPDGLRNAYESAMENLRSGRPGPNVQGSKPKIVFNGREYASEEEMPQEEGWLYKIAIDGLKTDRGSDTRLCSAAIEPASGVAPSRRSKILFIVGGAILALLLFFYLLSNGY
jgi:hypothetical protein